MPRLAMDYSKCVIYKIVCRDPSVLECYIGHTTNFVKRKYQHKKNCKTKDFKVYQMIQENGGWDNWTMTPICEFPCENYIQACIKEEEYRVELQASLNNNKCYTGLLKNEYNKEYRETQKDKINEKNKEYRETHKDKISEKKQEYYEKNKEQISEKNKEYCETHKDKISEKKKEYYEKNKDKIIEKARLRYQQKKLVQTENKNI